MTSPAPDAAVPNAQQPAPVPAEEPPQSELNGHASVDEPPTKPSPKPAAETRFEPAATEEKSAPPPAESPKVDAEKPLLNGSATPNDDVESSGPANDTAEMKDAVPAGKADPKSPITPKGEEEPKRSAQQTVAAAAEMKEEPEPEPQGAEAKGEPAETSHVPATVQQSEDVQMADTAAASQSAEAADQKPPTPSAQPADPAKEQAPDAEMTDAPAEASASPAKPTDAKVAGDAAAPPTSDVDLGPASMSQLVIETKEKMSPVGASVDVSMPDAPSAKVARERDDDSAEEPAPKRARTEPMEDAPVEPVPADGPVDASAEIMATETENSGLESAITKLPHWNDPETCARTISPYQRREIRKIIGRVRKTKSGSNFRDSVQKLWPAIWDGYIQRIDKPMDLGELDRSLRDPSNPTVTLGQFKKDLVLIFENALSFNGSAHDITAAAANVVKTVWEEAVPIPAEEPARPKAVPKPKPVRESRAVAIAEAAAARRQSAGPAASPSADAPATNTASSVVAAPAPAPAPAPEQSADRRSSTATDGDRPKRTVRAPKSKDIDYTTKPSRKKLKPELQFCDEVLTELMHPKNQHINTWFMDPVDAEGLKIPTYYAQIKKPMDLHKVQRMMSNGDISSLKEFDKNVRLIFDNCYKFNGPPDEGNPVSLIGKKLEDVYLAQMKNKDAWLGKHAAKASAPAASASNASDEDDEDEDDGEDAAYPAADSKEIEELQAKLDEETKKLNGMLLGGQQGLIDIQKGIVDMVQKALMKAAQNTQQSRSKNEKPAKKPGKGGKSKATGGTGPRKSASGAAHAKKAGGSKKTVSKKTLTAADKDQIASAINLLDHANVERAIELIKKDTGQNENNEGELELDIDQLSNDALLKLWELCKKVLPGFGKDSATASNQSPAANRSGPAKQASKSAAKPKKNKPMSAQEQEAKIAELTALCDLFEPGQGPTDTRKVAQRPNEARQVTHGATHMSESSDESSSEEE